MMMLFVYLFLVLAIIVLAVLLTRQSSLAEPSLPAQEPECGNSILEESGLDLAERIFDPGDYRWLKEEIGFPGLARELARQRKVMALMWLRCLRSSFNELIRVPQASGETTGVDSNSTSRATTLQTIRFQLLLSYALAVVWIFGPYTRIAPSFAWLRPITVRGGHRERFGFRF